MLIDKKILSKSPVYLQKIFSTKLIEVDKNTFNEGAFGDKGWLNEKIKKGQSNVFVYFAGKGMIHIRTLHI